MRNCSMHDQVLHGDEGELPDHHVADTYYHKTEPDSDGEWVSYHPPHRRVHRKAKPFTIDVED